MAHANDSGEFSPMGDRKGGVDTTKHGLSQDSESRKGMAPQYSKMANFNKVSSISYEKKADD